MSLKDLVRTARRLVVSERDEEAETARRARLEATMVAGREVFDAKSIPGFKRLLAEITERIQRHGANLDAMDIDRLPAQVGTNYLARKQELHSLLAWVDETVDEGAKAQRRLAE